MRQKILRLLIQHSSLTNLIFFFYYNQIIKNTLGVRIKVFKNKRKHTIISYTGSDIRLSEKGKHLLTNSGAVSVASSISVDSELISNLEKIFALPAYSQPLKIMLLGDSITHGVRGKDDRDSGGYRIELQNKLVASGLKVEFVGSQCSEVECLTKSYHEGHCGWTIKQIANSIDEWLKIFQPDLILLMIGTNDTRKSSLKMMINEFIGLLDQITTRAPKTRVLVSSIPPIHPAATRAIRGIRATYFNTAIPMIVKCKAAQGKKIDFVDMTSLTINDLTSSLSLQLDNGLHPNAQGYSKIANLWYDAVLKVVNTQQISIKTR